MIQSRSCEKTLMAPSTVYVNSPNSSSIFFKKNTLPNWQKIMWTPKTKNRSEWRFWKKKMDHLRVHTGCLWWIFGEFSKAPMFSIQIPRRRNRLRTHLSHTPRKTPLKYESLIVAPLNIQIMNEIPLFFSTKKKLGVVASTSYTCIHQSIPGITIGWKKCKESTVDFKPKVFFFWGGGHVSPLSWKFYCLSH